MAEIEITDAMQIYTADPARRGMHDLMVTYSVDKARIYMLAIPIEEVTTPDGKIDHPKVFEKIKEAERERAKLVGQKFKI